MFPVINTADGEDEPGGNVGWKWVGVPLMPRLPLPLSSSQAGITHPGSPKVLSHRSLALMTSDSSEMFHIKTTHCSFLLPLHFSPIPAPGLALAMDGMSLHSHISKS